MGYCVSMEINLGIPADKVEAAHSAVKELNASMDNANAGSLVDEFAEWGFDCLVSDKTGAITNVYWEGEKWRNHEVFLITIAPFVRDGSKLTVIGEDGEVWGYEFEAGTIYGTSMVMKRDEIPLN